MITKPKPKNKKDERKSLVKKLDEICREIVLARDVICVCPPPNNGHSQVLQCGHLITRSKLSVRFDLLNLSCQCSSCNLVHEFMPHRYINWFIGAFGLDKYLSLCEVSEKVVKMQIYELQELYEQFQAIHNKQAEDKDFLPRFTQAEILSGLWRNK